MFIMVLPFVSLNHFLVRYGPSGRVGSDDHKRSRLMETLCRRLVINWNNGVTDAPVRDIDARLPLFRGPASSASVGTGLMGNHSSQIQSRPALGFFISSGGSLRVLLAGESALLRIAHEDKCRTLFSLSDPLESCHLLAE